MLTVYVYVHNHVDVTLDMLSSITAKSVVICIYENNNSFFFFFLVFCNIFLIILDGGSVLMLPR